MILGIIKTRLPSNRSPLYVVCLILWLNGKLFAQEESRDSNMVVCLCADADLSPAGVMLAHEHAKGFFKLSYAAMRMNMQHIFSGTDLIKESNVFNSYLMAPTYMTMDMHMIMLMYGVTNRLSIMTMLGYNVNNMSMTSFASSAGSTNVASGGHSHGGGTGEMDMKSSGFGDTKIQASYQFVNNKLDVFGNIGLSLPTGNFYFSGEDNDAMYPNQRYPYSMQLGSGSFELLSGIVGLYSTGKLISGVQVNSIIRIHDNEIGYRKGDEINANVWIAYKWLSWFSSSVRVNGVSESSINGLDADLTAIMEPAADYRNYGGNWLNFYLGANFYFNKSIFQDSKLAVEIGAPVYNNVSGMQMVAEYGGVFNWSFYF